MTAEQLIRIHEMADDEREMFWCRCCKERPHYMVHLGKEYWSLLCRSHAEDLRKCLDVALKGESR